MRDKKLKSDISIIHKQNGALLTLIYKINTLTTLLHFKIYVKMINATYKRVVFFTHLLAS